MTHKPRNITEREHLKNLDRKAKRGGSTKLHNLTRVSAFNPAKNAAASSMSDPAASMVLPTPATTAHFYGGVTATASSLSGAAQGTGGTGAAAGAAGVSGSGGKPSKPSVGSAGSGNSPDLPGGVSNRGGAGGGGNAPGGVATNGASANQYGSRYAHELFALLRDYMNKCDLTSYGPKIQPAANNWTQMITNDRKNFSIMVNKVLGEMKAVFKNEERMVNATSPLYVFGDIHGNLHDLRYYERELWPSGPGRARLSFVFLGDLVDRGHHSLEVVLYLFCCKLMSKKNTFVLVRGNHELKAIQQAFTFHRECIEKLGPSLGVQIWTNINKCFDSMPVAALIDQHIFCCHGGIPMSSQNIKDIYNVPCPLTDPENQSPIAWEIFWNDPLTNNVFGEMAELLRLQSGSRAFSALKGFLPNNKRGTAYYFSESAALKFMEGNNLSHVIRAHECLPTGYTLHSNQKLITVFSSSKYCGGNNDAACVLVEADDVRVIRLDIGEKNAIPSPTPAGREISQTDR